MALSPRAFQVHEKNGRYAATGHIGQVERWFNTYEEARNFADNRRKFYESVHQEISQEPIPPPPPRPPDPTPKYQPYETIGFPDGRWGVAESDGVIRRWFTDENEAYEYETELVSKLPLPTGYPNQPTPGSRSTSTPIPPPSGQRSVPRSSRPANAPITAAGGLSASRSASIASASVPYADAQLQAWMARRAATAPTVATAPATVPTSSGFWTGFNFGPVAAPRSGDGFASRARSTVRRARAYVRLARMRAHRAARRASGRAGTHGFGGMGMGFGAGGNVAAAAFAARAMGVGGSGAIGQAIGAAGRIGAAFEVAGPPGAAVVAALELAQALRDAVNSARAFAEGVNASNRRLAPYSGVAAQAMAQFEVGEIRRTMDLAARTASGAAGLARQVNRMEDDWQSWRVGMQMLANEQASAATGLSGAFGRGLAPVGMAIERGLGAIDPEGRLAHAAGTAAGVTAWSGLVGLLNPMLGVLELARLAMGPAAPPAAKDIGPWGRFLRDAPVLGGAVHPRRLVAM